jgi:hypothetical protein
VPKTVELEINSTSLHMLGPITTLLATDLEVLHTFGPIITGRWTGSLQELYARLPMITL